MNQQFHDFSEPVLMRAIEENKKALSTKTDYERRSEQ